MGPPHFVQNFAVSRRVTLHFEQKGRLEVDALDPPLLRLSNNAVFEEIELDDPAELGRS